jgi:hypothetical protein
VRSSDGLKGVLKHQCEEEGPEGVPWAYLMWALDVMMNAWLMRHALLRDFI